MIVRARCVVPMAGAPIENGAVEVRGDRIVSVGVAAATRGDDVVDLGDVALLPGLINAHCHLDYTGLRGKIAPRGSFAEWIRAINAEKAALTPDDYIRSINDGFAEAQAFGTTSLVNYEAFPELIQQVEAPIQTWWCAEMIDVRPGSSADELVAAATRDGADGLAPHAPYTASAALYKRAAAEEGMLRTSHVAESREEMEMFRDARGELYDFLAGIGRDMSDCGGSTPFRTFAMSLSGRRGAPSLPSDWVVAHLNELDAADLALVGENAERLHVVHCPRSHDYFGHTRFRFEELRQAGVNICLATDSLASAPDLSLFAEMRAFQRTHPNVSAEEVVKMVTVNAARAVSRANDLGCLSENYIADMIAVPFTGKAEEVYEGILENEKRVSWMMLKGEIRHGSC